MRKMKRMILRTLCLAAILCLLAPYALATGSLPYDCYNYDYWNNILYTPAPYVPNGNISGVSLIWQGESLGAFRSPQDLCVSPDGKLYIADTGNNRIVVLSEDMKTVLQVIDGFEAEGKHETFNAPYGVAVSENQQLYIADSQNRRIVVLELDGTFVKYVQNPQSEVLDEKFVFTPLKVSVDYADRVYCVAQNMFQGIMVFSSEGDFTGFFGTISVKISLWERFWRKVSTKEERSKQQLFIPTEFTGIDVDEEGFVYASNKDTDGIQAVRRLNPRGEDVIRKGPKENVGGDLVFNSIGIYSGPSQISRMITRAICSTYSAVSAHRKALSACPQPLSNWTATCWCLIPCRQP